jgi:hypothetical protein
MSVLAKSAICVSSTIRVKVHQLDGSSEDEQECEEGDEENPRQRIRRPDSVAQNHKYSRLYTRTSKPPMNEEARSKK